MKTVDEKLIVSAYEQHTTGYLSNLVF